MAYRTLFLGIAQIQGILPDRDRIVLITLRHTDAQWKQDVSDLPDSCADQNIVWKSARKIKRHLAGIITRLWLESPCDRDLILRAAAKVVVQNEEAIRTFLEAEPSDTLTRGTSGANP